MSRPQARVDREFEELVVYSVIATLAEPSGHRLLGRLNGVRLLARDKQVRVPAGGVVQDELSPRVLCGRQGLNHIHPF